MYSVKEKTVYEGVYVHWARRLKNSDNGNPRYRIWFCYEKDSRLSDFSAVTDSDAGWMFRLPEAHALEGKKCNIVLHRPRKNLYINKMELV